MRCATYLKGRVGIYILQVYKRKNGVVDGTGGGTAAKGTEATGIIVKPYTHTFTNSHTHTHTCVALGDISVYTVCIYIYINICTERLTEGGTCTRAHTAGAHYAAAFDRIMENRSEATFI